MADHYFAATVMGGQLHVHGLGAKEPWDSYTLEYREAEIVDIFTNPRIGDRKTNTAKELERFVRESSLPAVRVWIRAGLEGAAQGLREGPRAQKWTGRPPSNSVG